MVIAAKSVSTVGGSQTLNRVRQGSKDLTAAVEAYSSEAARGNGNKVCADGNCKKVRHNAMLDALKKVMPGEMKAKLAEQGVDLKDLLKAGTRAVNNLKKSEDPSSQALFKAITAGVKDLNNATQMFMSNVENIYKGNDTKLQAALDQFLTDLYTNAGFKKAVIVETLEAFRNIPEDAKTMVNNLTGQLAERLSTTGLLKAGKAALDQATKLVA